MEPSGSTHHRRRRIDDARCLRDALRYEIAVSEDALRQLPDERELTARFGCSRNAVREALNLLRDEHLIERRQGAGTLVVGSRSPLTGGDSQGLVHTIADGPSRVRYEMLDVREVSSSGAIGVLLGVRREEPLIVVPRLTIVDDIPTCLWDTFVPQPLGLKMAASASCGDFFEMIEDALGTQISEVRLRLEAVIADASVCDLLDVHPGEPLLRFERVIEDVHGKVVALSFGRARADKLALEIHNHRCAPNTAPAAEGEREVPAS